MSLAERDAKRFGRNLFLIRRRRDLSQARLAALAGMSIDGVHKIELGKRSPRLATVLALADALSVDPCELLKGLRP
ncbi:MAG TPA: helix-turn-helix transcriptional regulator [Solirubrobacterales bacterium]|jgi:transcriptional regulator with XRE-family HTH domain|nr:helix-turn-helix transcriptional regulator [Solirubrobacterales bacterium]